MHLGGALQWSRQRAGDDLLPRLFSPTSTKFQRYRSSDGGGGQRRGALVELKRP